MDRKNFLKTTLVAGAGLTLSAQRANSITSTRKTNKLLNAYYLRGHMYAMVPRQVREDMKWMADVGTNVVSVAVLEQDLFAAVKNIEIICSEAAKVGMDVWAVPSRWGGLVAGAPKVPSMFTILNSETWMKSKDGSYLESNVSGRISSIFHPATSEFMADTAIKTFKTWDMKGLIWDEPKSLIKDYHELAVEKLGEDAPIQDYIKENVSFFSNVNQDIKKAFPNKKIGFFIYAFNDDMVVNECAKIQHLDFYGCDGRPWKADDGGSQESKGKVLLGGVGQRFIDAARKNGKKSLWLLENHNMADSDIPLLEDNIDEVVSSDIDHLIYYYYPRNLSQPEQIMNIIKRHVVNF